MLTRNFEIIPAIDVLRGRAVRLAAGQRDAVTLEGGDPVELARRVLADGRYGLRAARPARATVEDAFVSRVRSEGEVA